MRHSSLALNPHLENHNTLYPSPPQSRAWRYPGQHTVICASYSKHSPELLSFTSLKSPDYLSSTQNSSEILVHSFVTLRIDYCNALPTRLPNKLNDRLLIIQPPGSLPAPNQRTTSPLSPPILLAFGKILYTIRVTYKALYNLTPTYLCDLLCEYAPFAQPWQD